MHRHVQSASRRDPATESPGPAIAPRLLAWFDEHGRHDLPWQQQRSLYHVWVSEIMLQQTQVRTVIPYFERFISRFPDPASLAAAPLDAVLQHWSGLGYYARARNLHAAARVVVQHHGGRFPQRHEDVLALPGIGRSTAGAILAQALEQRHPILDGNVKRVLARHELIEGWPGQRAVEQRLWAAAEAHTPAQRIADYTQAIMDLGATLCRRSRPACDQCPLRDSCRAHATGRTGQLPTRRPRPRRPQRSTRLLLLRDRSGRILLQQRPPSGIWGGLWCPPEISPGPVEAWASEHLGLRVRHTASWRGLRHEFTHFTLDIHPELAELDDTPGTGRVLDAPGLLWYNVRLPEACGIAAPIKHLLDLAAARDEVEEPS